MLLRRVVALLAAGYVAGWSAGAMAGDDPMTDDTVVVKTEGSHRLLLPNDWPVQQQDGLVTPAPVEEYLSLKFGQVRTKFESVDERLDRLERQVAELAQQQKDLLKGLKRLDERSSAQKPQP